MACPVCGREMETMDGTCAACRGVSAPVAEQPLELSEAAKKTNRKVAFFAGCYILFSVLFLGGVMVMTFLGNKVSQEWETVDGKMVRRQSPDESEGQAPTPRNSAPRQPPIFYFKTQSWVSVAFSPDGKYLVAGASPATEAARTIVKWSAISNGVAAGTSRSVQVKNHRVVDVAFSPDGGAVVASYALFGKQQGRISDVWDTRNAKLLHSYSSQMGIGYKSLFPVANENGKTLVRLGVLTKFGKPLVRPQIRLDNAVTGKPGKTVNLNVKDGISATFALSEDGRTVATGAYLPTPPNPKASTSSRISAYDVDSGRRLLALPDNADPRFDIALSPDHRLLAAGKKGSGVQLWNIREGRVVATIGQGEMDDNCLAFSPDGRLLATAGGASPVVSLWDVKTGELKLTLDDLSGELSSIAFSPDGRYLATGNMEGTVRLWQLGA